MINLTRKTPRDLGSTGGSLGYKEGSGGRSTIQDIAIGEQPKGQGCREADEQAHHRTRAKQLQRPRPCLP